MRFVLYVDQNNSDMLLFRRACERYGFGPHIRVVSDGEEAQAYLAGAGKYRDRSLFPLPSVIILEMRLPQLTAFELVQWIRAEAKLLKIPVVLFTSWEMPSDIEMAYKLGANSYVLKANDPIRFEEQVRRLLDFWLRSNVVHGKVPVGLENASKPPSPDQLN